MSSLWCWLHAYRQRGTYWNTSVRPDGAITHSTKKEKVLKFSHRPFSPQTSCQTLLKCNLKPPQEVDLFAKIAVTRCLRQQKLHLPQFSRPEIWNQGVDRAGATESVQWESAPGLLQIMGFAGDLWSLVGYRRNTANSKLCLCAMGVCVCVFVCVWMHRHVQTSPVQVESTLDFPYFSVSSF